MRLVSVLLVFGTLFLCGCPVHNGWRERQDRWEEKRKPDVYLAKR
jgi:hypothetical protein